MATQEQLVEYLKRVSADLHDTRVRLREAEERSQEPVAVVAMACRFPGGVDSPEALWRLVAGDVDAITGFPDDRGWDLANLYHPDPDHPGTCYVREGGFVDDADKFDAAFFGISPREALAISPQQRLLLETAWELLERAGIDPVSLKGSATGVYAGTATTGSATQQDPAQVTEGYAGNAPSLLSGRVSYTLGLEGPAVTIETACSSSLVAMHLAAQALRQGECGLALAGGVTVMATPEVFTGFSRQRGLAADGRCKPFAAAADGTAWGEGVGLVLLERLSAARRNGHPVLAVIRGSAVNQDGASNGFTAPNGPAQQRVIRQALAAARLSPVEVDVVEAHGTGTRLGDPIEADALSATYGRERPADRPLWLGSVKSNIGHTQGAAGVAGVIKMVMAMRHGRLPASLNAPELTPHVDWETSGVRLLTEAADWPRDDRPRRAGVSSFGISGTNAHLILEQAEQDETPAAAEDPAGVPLPWVLSARSAEALRGQAAALAAYAGDLSRADVGWSLATTRSAFEHRAVVVGADRDELLAGLSALAAGEIHPAVVASGAAVGGAGPVLVFPGQGSQWAGMGAELLETSAVFAARIAECERALSPHVDWSLTEVLRGGEMSRVDVIQPVLWAVMVSLAAVWADYGVRPAAVVGHSQGEIAAACVAGALSLEDAAKVVALRSKALRRLAGGGAMASLGVDEKQAAVLLAEHAPGAAVAAVNGPGSVVVSGPPDQVAAVVAAAEAAGQRARTIDVDYASHGPQVEQIRDELTQVLAGVGPARAEVRFYSTVTGGRIDTAELDAAYWVTNLREPVRFADAVRALLADKHRVFIEASPHPVLTVGMQETFEQAGLDAATVPTLRRDEGGPAQLAAAAAQAFAAGVAVDWTRWFPADPAPRVVDLPTYAFQRQRFWPDTPAGSGGDPAGLGLVAAGHPLLGAAVEPADGGTLLLTGRLPAASGGWLADHRVLDTALLPGAGLVELALRAADEAGCAAVEELALRTPLVLPSSGGLRLQVAVGAPGEDGRRDVRVYSRPDREGPAEWSCHAVGVLAPAAAGRPDALAGPWPPPGAEPVDLSGFYTDAEAAGYGYGPAFRGVRAVWRHGPDVLAEVALPEEAGKAAGFGIHPALLDAALHPALVLDRPGGVWLPFAWSGVSLWAGEASAVRVRLTLEDHDVRVLVADPSGAPVLSVDSVTMRPADADRLRDGRRADGLFTLDWTPLPETPGTAEPDDWAVLGADALPGAPCHADLDALLDGPVPPLVLTAVPGGDGPAAVERTLALVQDWLAEPRLADSRLVLVTRGAVDPVTDPAAAGVWGLVRTAQAENPGTFALLDLEPDAPADAVPSAVARALDAGEPQAALRDGRVLVPRLVRAGAGGEPAALDGSVLITGGTGVLGGLVAEHLVRSRGVRDLVLVSRGGSVDDLVARLSELGARVRVVAADVADGDAVRELVAGIEPPLAGVVHAAGVLDDAVITSQSPERLARVWAAKAAGAENLHAATVDLPLSMFVIFSSAAGVVGNPGQAGYAAANAYVDALAARRRAAGLPALSIAWGLWEQGSAMTRHLDDADLTRLRGIGMRPLPADRGLALFDAACGSDAALLVAADVDLAGLSGEVPAVLRGLAGRVRRRMAAAGADASALAARLAGLDAAGRLEAVLDLARECVAVVLGYRSPGEVGVNASFKDLGFDSLTAVELRNRLSAASGLRLPATLVFDHPTPKTLAEYLCGRLTGENTAPPVDAAATRGTEEPVAIVGMACRFPGGVSSPEGLWELVSRGGDAMGEFPEGRGWDLAGLFHPDPDHPGTSYAREGAFLNDASGFDAGFFGISPREALAMDPQQRLLLETSWEVLERAGIDPASLRGSRTGVYAGVMYHDYAAGLTARDAKLEGYAMLAGSGSVISGRISYTLGLEGPAVTVDTACSSSLVAMHLAAQALRQGECGLALAGGVTVMATPEVFTGFSRQRGLAPDGRCKPFAAAADGTGWGEGVGLLLLERLSDAERNGHEVLAVIRGSAVNQDGASNGLTAPNGPSQQRVIGQALASARLSAAEVDAVEGHGTGTTLGDPIEAQALLATYGQGRAEDRPLWLGSVKSNIGHTQAAAGVAGVIKMVMAMRHGVLPASLHIDEPTPHVDWESGAVRLLSEPVEWPDTERPRRVGVSSFGASGTNAHLILEQGPEAVRAEAVPTDGVVPWVLSARGLDGLRAQAAVLAEYVTADPGLSPADVAWSLATTRAALENRAVVVGEDRDELLAGLEALEPADSSRTGKRVWLFSGQGSQRVGMGAELYERFPVFASAFDEVADLLDLPLREVVFEGEPDVLDHTSYAQAGLFALQVALARLLDSFGLRPDVVIGHSIGEVAAAHVAGVFDLADACRLVSARARLMGGLPEGGAMAAIEATEEELDLARQVSVAAVNTPDSTVVSGPADEVEALVEEWKGKGRKTKNLTVSHAFHSVLMDPILEEFTEAISGLTFQQPKIPLISNLTGEPADERITTPQYWAQHIRRPVRFQPAIAHVAADAGVFFELGPDPVLATAAQHSLDDTNPLVTSALNAKQPEIRAFAEAIGRLHAAGDSIDWTPWFPADPTPRVLGLPTYAFQHKPYWLTSGGNPGDATGLGLAAVGHPLLGAAVELAEESTYVLTGLLTRRTQPWLDEHVVAGTVLLPGAALVEWALRAADETGCAAVEELTLQAPLVLPASGGLRVQVKVAAPGEDGRREVRIYSRPGDDPGEGWICHAVGTLTPQAGTTGDALTGQWPPAGALPIDAEGCYERAAEAGYVYGPTFQGLTAAWREGADLLAEVALPERAAEQADGYGIHPALLDAALHPALLAGGTEDDDRTWLPFTWTGVALHAAGAGRVRVRLTPVDTGDDAERGLRVAVADTAGGPVLDVEQVVMRPVSVRQAGPGGTRGLFTLDWTALSAEPPERTGVWAVLGEDRLGLREATHAPHHPDLAALLDADTLPETVLTAADATGMSAADGLALAGRTLELVQAWLAEPALADAHLVVVTREAVAVGDENAVEPAGAGVWGLLRSAQAEHPGRFTLLDLAGGESIDDLVATAGTALAAGESQAAVRDGRILVPRLARAGAPSELVAPPGEQAWRLVMTRNGTVEDLAVTPCPEVLEPLAPGHVRVAVRAAGLNFRDVLISLGMVPDTGGLGGEGAGIVTEAAPDVTSVAVGDRVMGLFAGAFGPLATADARTIAPVPDGWSFEQAAAAPVVFLTALYGLTDLARLGSGESVLIHTATGGVGMAAVQLARHLGAEVYATASPAKHAVLEEMGVDATHRANSRDLDFEDTLRAATGGGVDVVLNSLAGEFTDASLRLLREGGRFMEMGKTDIRDPGRVAAQHPGVRYRVFDLVTDAGPDRIKELFATLTGLFATGALHPLPVDTWPLARARQALRHMGQARHTGKLVLEVPAPLNPEGTVLITGGTGTLGGLVAEHLVRTWHVRRLLLAGRRGAAATDADRLAARLEELGAEVSVAALDTTDAAALADTIATIDPAHPLTGVVHAAGVVEDAVVTAQTAAGLERVWAAKAESAANLHEATAHLRLGLFAIFSSAAATLGSPGQANYAAANAYCDALAAYRRAHGYSGLSVGWGLWAAGGGMSGDLADADRARMSRLGMHAMSAEQGLALLDAAYAHGEPHLVAAGLDLATLAAQPAGVLPPPLRALAGGTEARPSAANEQRPADWTNRLAGLTAAEQQDALLALVRTHASTVLGHTDPGAVPADAAFKELGFDSLTSVELRNRLGAATGLRLPAALVFRHPTPAAIAGHLRERLCPAGADPSTPVFGELASLETAMADFTPDADARGRLAKRLETLLWRLTDASAAEDQTDDGEALEAASDDEMFELIDRELGSS